MSTSYQEIPAYVTPIRRSDVAAMSWIFTIIGIAYEIYLTNVLHSHFIYSLSFCWITSIVLLVCEYEIWSKGRRCMLFILAICLFIYIGTAISIFSDTIILNIDDPEDWITIKKKWIINFIFAFLMSGSIVPVFCLYPSWEESITSPHPAAPAVSAILSQIRKENEITHV